MRFIIYGAGGIGGVIGAELHRAGMDVVLIARGDHLKAVQADGLRYETPQGAETLFVPAVGHPEEITFGDADVVLLTVKSQHSQVALDDLRAVAGDRVPVICCQNGVANERMALRRFEHVYGMLVYLPAQHVEPGRVQSHAQLKRGVLDLGRYPSGRDARAVAVGQHLERANLIARADDRVMRLKYAKLLQNLGNAVNAALAPGADADAIAEIMRAEGRACLRAAGIDWASEDEFKARRARDFAYGTIDGVARQGGSSRQSLIRGTGDIETDYLNGEICLLGRLHGVPTPANAVLQRLANALARRRGAPGSLAADEVRRLIETESRQVA